MTVFETPVNSPMGFLIISAMLPRNREWARKFGTTLRVHTELMRTEEYTSHKELFSDDDIDTYRQEHWVDVVTPYGTKHFIVKQQQILDCARNLMTCKGFITEESCLDVKAS